MPFPAFLAAAARIAASAGARMAAARAATGAAAREAELAAWRKSTQAKGTKLDKQVDTFNRLFKDHPANQPPPLPGNRGMGEKYLDQMKESLGKQADKWGADPIGMGTESMNSFARNVEGGKSVGQGIIDGLKRIDPTGLAGLAEAGMNAAGAVATRGVKNAKSVVQDDFLGLVDNVLPDAASKFIHALNDLTNAIVERGRYLQKYNADLGQAAAAADVRRIQSEMREAQTVGKNYSRVIDEQSKLETKLRDVTAPIKDAIAGTLATVLEKLNRFLDMLPLTEITGTMGAISKVSQAVLSGDPEKIVQAILDLPENIARAILGDDRDEDDLNAVMARALQDMKAMPQGPLADPRARRGGGAFNFPAVRGL